ncbi:hypothetical protein MASR1M8_17180 [Thermomonas brevis]
MRRPRLELPGIPLHITQRGVNRCATFIDDQDCAAYLQALEHVSHEHDVAIHGYVLMGNHVHLLVSAGLAGVISRMMQALGRRYVGLQCASRPYGHALGGPLQVLPGR